MSNSNVEKSEIVICDNCRGLGIVSRRVSINDYEDETCSYCLGKGRLRRITKITHEKLKD